MFTPELERQRAAKLARTKQYYDDLRAQIAEQHRKTESPLPYSTTNQSYASNLSQNNNYNQRRVAPDSHIQNNRPQITYDSSSMSDRSSNNGSSSLIVPYQNQQSSRSYMSSTPVLPDFTKTSIAPLNLAVTNFQFDTLPDLPRQMTHQNSIDPETFNDRLRSLQAQIDEQHNDYIHASESQDRLKSQQFPDMMQLINEIDNALQKTVNGRIPMHLKNINEMTGHNREILGSSDSNFSSLTNIIRDSMSERQNQISSFQSKLSEFVDSISNNILDVRADAGRQRDMLDLAQQKLSKLEKKDSQTIEYLSKSNTDFETVDNAATAKFLSLQRDVSGAVKFVAQQLSSQIQEESNVRVTAQSQLHGQAEEINKNAAEYIEKMQESISEMASIFQTSMSDLTTSISGAIEQTQQETEDRTSDLSNKIDSVVVDTDSTMKLMSNEIVSTISEIRDNFSMGRNTIETSISTENNARAKNHDIIKDKFVHLKNIIAREQDIQMTQVEGLCRDLEKNVTEYTQKVMIPINIDIEYIKAKKIEMDRVESMVETLETTLTQSRSQCFEAIASLQRSIDNIVGSTNEMKMSLNTRIEELNNDLQAIETINKTDLAMKNDVMNMQETVSNDTEDRIKFVEQQLAVALSNLSELTKGADEKPEPIIQPGSVTLQMLVNKAREGDIGQKDVEFPNKKPYGLPDVEEDEDDSKSTKTKKRRHHRKHHHSHKENADDNVELEESVSNSKNDEVENDDVNSITEKSLENKEEESEKDNLDNDQKDEDNDKSDSENKEEEVEKESQNEGDENDSDNNEEENNNTDEDDSVNNEEEDNENDSENNNTDEDDSENNEEDENESENDSDNQEEDVNEIPQKKENVVVE